MLGAIEECLRSQNTDNGMSNNNDNKICVMEANSIWHLRASWLRGQAVVREVEKLRPGEASHPSSLGKAPSEFERGRSYLTALPRQALDSAAPEGSAWPPEALRRRARRQSPCPMATTTTTSWLMTCTTTTATTATNRYSQPPAANAAIYSCYLTYSVLHLRVIAHDPRLRRYFQQNGQKKRSTLKHGNRRKRIYGGALVMRIPLGVWMLVVTATRH